MDDALYLSQPNASSGKVIVIMEHTQKDGTPRIVTECSLPLTGRRAAHAVITDLAFIEVVPEGLLLREAAAGIGVEEIQALTEPRLIVSPDLKEMEL